jgi:hypothetical protein
VRPEATPATKRRQEANEPRDRASKGTDAEPKPSSWRKATPTRRTRPDAKVRRGLRTRRERKGSPWNLGGPAAPARYRGGDPDPTPRPTGVVSVPVGANKRRRDWKPTRRGETEAARNGGKGVRISSDVPAKRGNSPGGPRGGKGEIESWNRRRERRRAYRSPKASPRDFVG